MTKNGIQYVEKTKVDLYQLPVFIERYFVHLRRSKTQKLAWQKTEKEFVSVFGEQRFSSFDSFRQVRNSYLLTRQQETLNHT